MKLTYRGVIVEQDGKFLISGCNFDAEGGNVDIDEMLRLVRQAWETRCAYPSFSHTSEEERK
jgi:hypothetical protein